MDTQQEYEAFRRKNRRRLTGTVIFVVIAAAALIAVFSAEKPENRKQTATLNLPESGRTVVLENPLAQISEDFSENAAQPPADASETFRQPETAKTPEILPPKVGASSAAQPQETPAPKAAAPAPSAQKPVKPAAKSETRPAKTIDKTESKTTKPAAKSEPKPAAKSESKPTKSESKPAAENKNPRKTPDPAEKERARKILEGGAGKTAAPAVHMVQAGAFTDSRQAEVRVQQLASLGIAGKIHKTRTARGEVSRVRIGPLKSAADAERIRNTLHDNGIDAIIMP